MRLLCTLTSLVILAGDLPAADLKPANAENAITTSGKVFLGETPLNIRQFFAGRGARDIITARAGNVLAFHGNQLRESTTAG